MKPCSQKIFLFAIILTLTTAIYGQGGQDDTFQLAHFPRSYGISKQQLNADISNATTKEKVLSILAAREIPDGGGNIVIKIKRNNRYFWWTISKYNSRETEGNIILQSKSYASETIYNIDDFKILFKDTLVLFDTLTIPLLVLLTVILIVSPGSYFPGTIPLVTSLITGARKLMFA